MNFLARLFYRLTQLILILSLPIIIVMASAWYYTTYQLPDIDALNTVRLQVPLQIFTHDSKLIAAFGENRRIPVPYDQIPTKLIQAVLATEDQRYFQHPGIDIPGLIRAGLLLVATGRKEQGGSTITMQVARSFYLSRHKTFGRKLREILLALKIDHHLSKQKILELYLNKIFLGNRAYGVAAAAQIYYGKSLDKLTLDQYAMLAGLPQAPSALNPISHPVAAKKRRDHVLARMYDSGYITEKELRAALDTPLNASYHDLGVQVNAPYMAELVRQQLETMYGDSIYTDNFSVYTTLDSRLQKIADQAVQQGLIAYDQRHGYRGPERNLGVPGPGEMKAWQETLKKMFAVAGLEPAAVIDMTDQTVTVLRADGRLMIIPWAGLAWARRQVNPDFLGPMPHHTHDILHLGDVIRIMQLPDKSWRLAQIPKAQAGMVVLNPENGGMLALVGGFDYSLSKFDRMTDARRQPGSSFKPFIYSAALAKGDTLATLINDAPIIYQNPYNNTVWRPQNDERRFFGPTRLRIGLIHSYNLLTIRLLQQIGVDYAIRYAEPFGFSAMQLPHELSLALGTASVTPLQMAAAYAVFANSGFHVVPYAIDHIMQQGKLVYQARPLVACRDCAPPLPNDNTRAPRVISSENAFLITSALHDVIEHGTGVRARSLNRKDLSGKTGTTQNQVDAWFDGYNAQLVAVAWVGFDQQQQSLHEYGNKAALPIWMDFMKAALKNTPDHTPEQPPGIVSIRIDPITGRRADAENPAARFEYFMQPYLPRSSDDVASDGGDDAAPAAATSTSAEPGDGGLY